MGEPAAIFLFARCLTLDTSGRCWPSLNPVSRLMYSMHPAEKDMTLWSMNLSTARQLFYLNAILWREPGNFMGLVVLPKVFLPVVLFCTALSIAQAASSGETQSLRYVIADQDASGPGGSDMAGLLVFLQSPRVNLLGITVVTGDSWRDVEVAHTLRLLELMGRTDVKVYPGAAFPWCAHRSGRTRPRSSSAK